MLGNMMFQPLLISSMIEHAGRYHADTEIISKNTDTSIKRPIGEKSGKTRNVLPMYYSNSV